MLLFVFSLQGTPLDDPEVQERLKQRALSLGSVSSRHFFEGEPSMAVLAEDNKIDYQCRRLVTFGP